jgi:hypothetical protein
MNFPDARGEKLPEKLRAVYILHKYLWLQRTFAFYSFRSNPI